MALGIQKVRPAPELSLNRLLGAYFQLCTETGRSPLSRVVLRDIDRATDSTGFWRPSQLHYCKRSSVYQAMGFPGTVNLDPETQFMFDRGHVFGAWLAGYFKGMSGTLGVSDVQLERKTEDSNLRLRGHVDIQLNINGYEYLIEVKSKENVLTIEKLTAPDKIHILQLNDYMYLTGIHAGWLAYIGPVTVGGPTKSGERSTKIRVVEFFHRYDASLFEAESLKTLSLLSWFTENQDTVAPKTANVWFECPSCKFKDICNMDLTPNQVRQKL